MKGCDLLNTFLLHVYHNYEVLGPEMIKFCLKTLKM